MPSVFGMQRRERRPYVNLTSLIDILFMLLIFFMLSSTFKNYMGVDIALPESSTATSQQQSTHEISIDAAGAIFFAAQQVTPQELKGKLQELAKREPKAPLLLRADKHADFQDVLTVIDITRESGGGQLIIPALPKDEATGK